MPKHLINGLVLVFVVTTFSGCTVARDVKVRAYKQDKKRIDQVVEGKIGNWENAPDAYRTQDKDTRKVYFVEFTKEPPVEPNLKFLDQLVGAERLEDGTVAGAYDETEIIDHQHSDETYAAGTKRRKIRRVIRRAQPPATEYPTLEEDIYYEDEGLRVEDYETPVSNGGVVSYTVQKSDTLQKISKKFYDSYSKWPRIYKANESVLDSPDVVSPGMVLQIPVD